LFSFIAFGAGGVVPLLPFLFGAQAHVIVLATILGLAGLLAVGAALSFFTGRNALWSGLRMVLIGGAGIGQLPAYHARDAIAGGTLVRVLPECEGARVEVHALYPRHRSLSAKVRVFVEMVAEEMKRASDAMP